MPRYPQPPEKRFPRALADLTRKVRRLEHRMSGIDSGMPLALLPAVIDPSYTSGDPQAFINGSSTLTGPYKVIGDYVPAASDAVVVMPVPLTAVTVQAGSYVILGKTGGNQAAQVSQLLIGATSSGATSANLEVHSMIALASRGAPGTPPSGFFYLYMSSVDNKLHAKGPSGTDTALASP